MDKGLIHLLPDLQRTDVEDEKESISMLYTEMYKSVKFETNPVFFQSSVLRLRCFCCGNGVKRTINVHSLEAVVSHDRYIDYRTFLYPT